MTTTKNKWACIQPGAKCQRIEPNRGIIVYSVPFVAPVPMAGQVLSVTPTLFGDQLVIETDLPGFRSLQTMSNGVIFCSQIEAKIIKYKAGFVARKLDSMPVTDNVDNYLSARAVRMLDKVHKLQAAGFDVFNFWERPKVAFKMPKGESKLDVIQRINSIFGDDWDGISFTGGVKIWWGANQRK